MYKNIEFIKTRIPPYVIQNYYHDCPEVIFGESVRTAISTAIGYSSDDGGLIEVLYDQYMDYLSVDVSKIMDINPNQYSDIYEKYVHRPAEYLAEYLFGFTNHEISLALSYHDYDINTGTLILSYTGEMVD